jgi:hypothetical protein
MTQVIAQMQQMQMQNQQATQEQLMMTQQQAQNAQRTLTSPVPGDQSLNQPENQAQLPPEANAANAAAPGEENLLPAPTGTNEVQA